MRYILTRPIEGGTQWFDIRDTQDASNPNFCVVSISATLRDAKDMAEIILGFLNQRQPSTCRYCGILTEETKTGCSGQNSRGVHLIMNRP